jgi:hypothetical protein
MHILRSRTLERFILNSHTLIPSLVAAGTEQAPLGLSGERRQERMII